MKQLENIAAKFLAEYGEEDVDLIEGCIENILQLPSAIADGMKQMVFARAEGDYVAETLASVAATNRHFVNAAAAAMQILNRFADRYGIAAPFAETGTADAVVKAAEAMVAAFTEQATHEGHLPLACSPKHFVKKMLGNRLGE